MFKDHENYEPNGFNYYKAVKRAEQEKILKELRKESEPCEQSASGRQGALRKTNVSKARVSNLLNQPAVVPTARDEIDLMLACVTEAKEAPSAKGTVWMRAEKLYFAAYLNNSTLAENEKKFLRGPTTAAHIEATFKGYATAQKAFVAAREQEALAFSPPQFDVAETPTTAAALALTSIGAASSSAPAAGSSSEAVVATSSSAPEVTEKCATSRWKRKIDDGEPLLASAIGSLPKVAARQYLRAMGVTVPRSINNDIDSMRELLRKELGSESRWSKSQKS